MVASSTKKLVLVTGGTGFVAGHCILQLLNAGYAVRTTLRSLQRKNSVLESLRYGGATNLDDVSFIETTLTSGQNWDAAVKGCEYVLHVASPISLKIPKDENEMIVPAVEGTLRVLKAARDAGVTRVVLTSSFAAIGYSPKETAYTEEDWTDPNLPGQSAYVKSKTLAERAAWNFLKTEGGALELATVNPVGIFGPALNADLSGGFQVLKKMLDGKVPALPKINFGIVDVRDVADLHLRAMTRPEAKGERFLAVSGDFMFMHEAAMLMRTHLGEKAKRVPTRTLPDWTVRVAAIFSPMARGLLPHLRKHKAASNEKARHVLGWNPRSREEAVLATAESLIYFGQGKA